VDSFSPASGNQFALLPADNATGNFTKIVQRVPVKIVLRPEDVRQLGGRLVPGMSALAEIELHQKTAQPAAAAAH
jgi:membrane fusion protein (multidrug efflux system)